VPEPEPEPTPAEAQLVASLHDDGLSERAIAQQLGITRRRVHTLIN